jgi:hypothetical protein
MEEIKRIKDVPFEVYETKCLVCGKSIDLYWNGGELDYTECCGHRYELEHVQIDFVVNKI